ncbi:MAG: hypothetical protein KGM17_01015 [Sphingomonadales bacterium]|nr:hypothetical protein [Sphingomonadales bacterium]
MSLLDSILGQVGGNVDIAGIAAKVGIDPALAQQAVTALAGAQPQPGDTVATAAAQTGIDSGVMGQIAAQLGGESGLGQLNQMLQAHPQAAGLLNMLDRNGDGSPIDDVLGMAKGLFGKS